MRSTLPRREHLLRRVVLADICPLVGAYVSGRVELNGMTSWTYRSVSGDCQHLRDVDDELCLVLGGRCLGPGWTRAIFGPVRGLVGGAPPSRRSTVRCRAPGSRLPRRSTFRRARRSIAWCRSRTLLAVLCPRFCPRLWLLLWVSLSCPSSSRAWWLASPLSAFCALERSLSIVFSASRQVAVPASVGVGAVARSSGRSAVLLPLGSRADLLVSRRLALSCPRPRGPRRLRQVGACASLVAVCGAVSACRVAPLRSRLRARPVLLGSSCGSAVRFRVLVLRLPETPRGVAPRRSTFRSSMSPSAFGSRPGFSSRCRSGGSFRSDLGRRLVVAGGRLPADLQAVPIVVSRCDGPLLRALSVDPVSGPRWWPVTGHPWPLWPLWPSWPLWHVAPERRPSVAYPGLIQGRNRRFLFRASMALSEAFPQGKILGERPGSWGRSPLLLPSFLGPRTWH